MKGTVLERPRVAARVELAKKRGLLGLIRVAALVERQSELELSDDQLKKLLAIRSDMIRTKSKISADIRVARLELVHSTANNIGNIHPDQIRSALKNIYNLRLERKAATVDAFRKATDVLTDEQKSTLREHVRERLSECESEAEEDFTDID